jgi:hypothetical protein
VQQVPYFFRILPFAFGIQKLDARPAPNLRRLSPIVSFAAFLALFAFQEYNISYGDIFPESSLRWYAFLLVDFARQLISGV